jgi:WD40 repeat protein
MLPGHGHQGAVVALFVTADGKTLTTLGEDQTLRQWEMATGKELRTVRLPAGAGKPVLSPDGKMAAFGTPNNKFHLWDVTTGKERATPKLADVQFGQLVGGAGGVAFAADNKSVAVNDLDGWVRTFDTATGKESHKCSTRIGNQANLVFVNGATPGIALASDGVTVATVGSEPDNDNGFHDRSLSLIRLWNLTTGRHVRQCEARQLDVLALAFAPGGWTLAAAHADQTVSLWETATGKERCRLTCRGGLMAAVQDRFGQRSSGANVECLAFSRDGRFLAGGCSDRKIYLWNARTGRKLGEFAVHHGEIRSLTFTPDGQTLVGGSTDTTALTIDVAPLLPNADPPTDLEPQKLEAYWKDLSADAAGRGYQAVVALSRSPKQLLPLVRERVRPAAGIEQRQLNQLLADLDSKHFLVRQRATDELEKLGDLAEVPVKRALEGKPPLEVRHRLEQIMERLLTGQSPPPELLQALRAVETLELIGTPEAAQSLELLSRGVAGARLTREARAAADRLTRSK